MIKIRMLRVQGLRFLGLGDEELGIPGLRLRRVENQKGIHPKLEGPLTTFPAAAPAHKKIKHPV